MDAKRKRDAGVGKTVKSKACGALTWSGVTDKDAAVCDKEHCPCLLIGSF